MTDTSARAEYIAQLHTMTLDQMLDDLMDCARQDKFGSHGEQKRILRLAIADLTAGDRRFPYNPDAFLQRLNTNQTSTERNNQA